MKTKRIIIFLIAAVVLQINVYAADALYRFMHNDHLALIIGEVVVVEEKLISVRVEKNLVSTQSLNTPGRKQVKLANADIKAPLEYMHFNEGQHGSAAHPVKGDFILISLEES